MSGVPQEAKSSPSSTPPQAASKRPKNDDPIGMHEASPSSSPCFALPVLSALVCVLPQLLTRASISLLRPPVSGILSPFCNVMFDTVKFLAVDQKKARWVRRNSGEAPLTIVGFQHRSTKNTSAPRLNRPRSPPPQDRVSQKKLPKLILNKANAQLDYEGDQARGFFSSAHSLALSSSPRRSPRAALEPCLTACGNTSHRPLSPCLCRPADRGPRRSEPQRSYVRLGERLAERQAVGKAAAAASAPTLPAAGSVLRAPPALDWPRACAGASCQQRQRVA